jgi:hypothetical protein
MRYAPRDARRSDGGALIAERHAARLPRASAPGRFRSRASGERLPARATPKFGLTFQAGRRAGAGRGVRPAKRCPRNTLQHSPPRRARLPGLADGSAKTRVTVEIGRRRRRPHRLRRANDADEAIDLMSCAARVVTNDSG